MSFASASHNKIDSRARRYPKRAGQEQFYQQESGSPRELPPHQLLPDSSNMNGKNTRALPLIALYSAQMQ
jgi:hypothetical protein